MLKSVGTEVGRSGRTRKKKYHHQEGDLTGRKSYFSMGEKGNPRRGRNRRRGCKRKTKAGAQEIFFAGVKKGGGLPKNAFYPKRAREKSWINKNNKKGTAWGNGGPEEM